MLRYLEMVRNRVAAQAAKPAAAVSAKAAGGSSLYEKLLTKEIRGDRSRLLQAMRFFVKNQFFEK